MGAVLGLSAGGLLLQGVITGCGSCAWIICRRSSHTRCNHRVLELLCFSSNVGAQSGSEIVKFECLNTGPRISVGLISLNVNTGCRYLAAVVSDYKSFADPQELSSKGHLVQ